MESYCGVPNQDLDKIIISLIKFYKLIFIINTNDRTVVVEIYLNLEAIFINDTHAIAAYSS